MVKVKKMCQWMIILLFCGSLCAGCSAQAEGELENTTGTEEITLTEAVDHDMSDVEETDLAEISEDTHEDAHENADEDDLVWYMELWAGYLEPVMTESELEQLENIEWDEKIRPYMEYDWIGDERIDRKLAYVNSWVMQLADLNLDGQPEMLVSEYFQYMEEDLTHIFTIQDGEVVYCGKIIASAAYEDNEFFGGLDYLPSYYIDAYQNESGEFRYLSCEDWCYSSGYYQIYASTFDGRSISDEPAFVIGYYDDQGEIIYSYAKGKWLEQNQETYDDRIAFEQIMEEYMAGYKKIDIDFIVSEYRVPAFAGELPEEQQEIVRKNIVAGFAKILGYMNNL